MIYDYWIINISGFFLRSLVPCLSMIYCKTLGKPKPGVQKDQLLGSPYTIDGDPAAQAKGNEGGLGSFRLFASLVLKKNMEVS